jgi:hypothetical protein
MTNVMRQAVTRFSVRNRKKKAERISAFMDQTGSRSVLLCGALGSGALPNEAIIERRIGERAERVMAFDVVDLGPQPWPFIVADARDMPFGDQEYDLAVANAVIEHVGGVDEQRQMVAEHTRVARNWVITTPNRWFPVESHTAALFTHWRPSWRDRQESFTRLLSKSEFRALLPAHARVVGRWWSPTFMAFYTATSVDQEA